MFRFSLKLSVLKLIFITLLFEFTNGQELNFIQKIDAFPVQDENSLPYPFPLLGGFNAPRPQFADIDGDNDPDLFIQENKGQLIFFENIGSNTNYQFKWITNIYNNINIDDWFRFVDMDNDMDFMSIGLGVNILEKRLTVDRSIPKNGHIKALEPGEFMQWIKRVRELELTLGFNNVLPTDDDREFSKKFFKSLYVNQDIKEGDIIYDDMLLARRPGDGIPVNYVDNVCGKRVSRDIEKNTKLSWDDLC